MISRGVVKLVRSLLVVALVMLSSLIIPLFPLPGPACPVAQASTDDTPYGKRKNLTKVTGMLHRSVRMYRLAADLWIKSS
jgi:hypothetical protein